MRNVLIVLWLLAVPLAPASAQLGVAIGLPRVSIGINLPVYPQLVAVPGYPVYYAPQLDSNYFFYDGMYWVYQRDNWYAASWYNGPWGLVAPQAVPLYLLRVPVRYYRRPPAYFHGWGSDAPPRWGEHWGSSWQRSHSGWDHWDRSSVPAPAPLPVYQRQFSGNRYPHVEQQQAIQLQHYRYQPQEAVVQQHYQAQQGPPRSPASPPTVRQAAPQARTAPAPGAQQATPAAQPQRQSSRPQPQAQPPQPNQMQPPHGAAPPQPQPPKAQSQGNCPQARGPAPEAKAQRQAPPPQPPPQNASPRQQQPPPAQGHAPAPEPRQGQEKVQDRGRDKGEPQGAERGK